MAHLFAGDVADGVREQDISMYAYGRKDFRDDDFVAFTKDDIIFGTRICECLVDFDSDRECTVGLDFNRIVKRLGDSLHGLAEEILVIGGLAPEGSALQIGFSGRPSCTGDQFRHGLSASDQDVLAGEGYLTEDRDLALLDVARTASDCNHIVWFKSKRRLPIHDKSVLDRE